MGKGDVETHSDLALVWW